MLRRSTALVALVGAFVAGANLATAQDGRSRTGSGHAGEYVPPSRTIIHVMPLRERPPEVGPPFVTPTVRGQAPSSIMAHLPLGSDLWIGGTQVLSNTDKAMSEIPFPFLEKDAKYYFTVRVEWTEDDKRVAQVHTFPLKGGEMHCVKIVARDAPEVEKALAANLAKLDKTDRAAVEGQKFCAVQTTIRLGSMGPPVKVAVNGKDVFLCCEGCKAAALRDPDTALKNAEKNKDKK